MLRRLKEATFDNFVPESNLKVGLPPKNRWGEQIPDAGTSCNNCKYLKDPKKMICGNKNFIAWQGPSKPAGSPKIPAKNPRQYCSIWWTTKGEQDDG